MSRTKPTPYLLLITAGLFSLPGCEGGPGTASTQLRSLQSCQQVTAALRQAALEHMRERLERNRDIALQGGYCLGLEDAGGSGGGGAPPSPSDPGSGASETSGTNNQVAGVDEPDFVKNDNEYIYTVTDGKLRIVDAWPAAEAQMVSETPIEGTPKKLFVTEKRALVYSSLDGESGGEDAPGWWQPPGECTYGYSCSFTGDGHPTKLTLVDISDRAAPQVLREIWMSGSMITARKIGSAVHTVLSDDGPTFEDLRYWPDDLDLCDASDAEIYVAFAELEQENTAAIQSAPVEDWLPSGEDSAHGSIGDSCQGFYASQMGDGAQMTSVLSLDMSSGEKARMTSVVSRPGAVYGSADSLYVAVPHQKQYGWGWYPSVEEDEASTVHQFELLDGPPKAMYRASGVVEGRVLNQFAMDEHEGHLRIATSNGRVPDPDVHSALTVLRRVGHELVVTGKVDDIAPTEDIRAVRFDGDRGFVVTFKKTDPLYAFDLSNPNDPAIAGELKIPGFSTYMHLLDEDHLLTIGYDADDQGDFAWFTGVLLQVFDVSDMTSPELVHKEVIGTRGSSSEALTNHLAFTYFAPKDALALPMTICEGGSGGGGYGDEMTFSGLMVFDVTAEDGFSERGRVDHPTGDDVTCYNWWTRASSQVKRSVIMDDYVYSISESLMKVNHLDGLATDLASIPLTD